MKVREKSIALLLVIAGIVSIYFLIDRMIIHKDRYFRSGYMDKAFVGLMESLIAGGVFRSEDGEVVLDEEALAKKNLRKKTAERVRDNMQFLYLKDGRLCFDRQSVSVSNSRTFADERVLRGGFFDRKGVPLVWSSVDERAWRQHRSYAYGTELFHVIGYYSPVFGRRGLEKELDDYLSGRNHPPVYRETADPLKNLQLGDNVFLTLDSVVQRRAYELLRDKRGAVVVLNVGSGEVIAAVSTPSFDPNTKDRNVWREAFGDNVEKPYENRAFSTLYPPGSTFKTVVASALLETGGKDSTNGNNRIFCNGRKNKYGISDIHVHGNVDLNKAYAESCNLYFSEAGVMLGQALLDYAGRFGFNADINLIPQIRESSLKAARSSVFTWSDTNKGTTDKSFFSPADFKRNPKLVAQGAIGQNLVMATPLQMALIAAAIANKGVLMNPYIIKEIRTGDGKKGMFTAKTVRMGRAVTEKTALKIKDLMEEVMQRGTGRDVKRIYFESGRYTTSPAIKNSSVVRVAGKTGTAEVGDRNGNGEIDPGEKPHSWFIGFAPAENPRFAVAVIAENQGFGSLTAAPIAVDVLAEVLNQSAPRQ
jgi:peptidoglycan glycosyltransferase